VPTRTIATGHWARRLAVALLAAWGCWLAVVTCSNATNALAASGAIARPAFASSNYELIESTTATYHPSHAAVWALFLAVIAWEACAAVLYLRAALWARRSAVPTDDELAARARAVDAAALAALFGMGLFAAFMLADEICIAYSLQAGHMRALAAQGVSWLVVRAALRD